MASHPDTTMLWRGKPIGPIQAHELYFDALASDSPQDVLDDLYDLVKTLWSVDPGCQVYDAVYRVNSGFRVPGDPTPRDSANNGLHPNEIYLFTHIELIDPTTNTRGGLWLKVVTVPKSFATRCPLPSFCTSAPTTCPSKGDDIYGFNPCRCGLPDRLSNLWRVAFSNNIWLSRFGPDTERGFGLARVVMTVNGKKKNAPVNQVRLLPVFELPDDAVVYRTQTKEMRDHNKAQDADGNYVNIDNQWYIDTSADGSGPSGPSSA